MKMQKHIFLELMIGWTLMCFQRVSIVQRFCYTLVGEARLWYESLKPIALDWNGLQIQFRQECSKIGNTREQLFHVWKSFHFGENTETLDAYVMHIRQVAAFLGYGKPQVSEVFKTLSIKTILGTLSNRRFKTNSRNSKKNNCKRENR